MKKSMTLTAALVTSAVVVSLMAVHFLVSRTGEEKQQKGEQLVAMRIHDAFVAKIIEPVIVANAMSGDRFLLDALAMESPDHEAEDVARVQTYLQGLKKTFSYSSVCLISHKTRRYYYDGGLLKVIDPAHDPGDLWYGHLVAGQKRWRTAIFREKDAEHSTMYINVVIKDSQGKVLGVVSTGICLKDMLDFISRYEQRYKVLNGEDVQESQEQKPAAAMNTPPSQPAREQIIIARMATLLRKHCEEPQLYLEHELSLNAVARACNTNRTYLGMYFASQGITYYIYISTSCALPTSRRATARP